MNPHTNQYHIFVFLRLSLLGEYHGFVSNTNPDWHDLQNPDGKNPEKAIAMLPDYFRAMYTEDAQAKEEVEFLFADGYMRSRGYDLYEYTADMDLEELIADMKAVGYTQTEMTAFATPFVAEMMAHDAVFYSLMPILLLGKHSSGITVDIPQPPCLETALAAIPQYIQFLTGKYVADYDAEGFINLDETLDALLREMADAQYGEQEQARFAAAWYDAIAAQNLVTLMQMRVYLTGEFRYAVAGKPITEISLPDKQDLGKAIALIPAYIAYVQTYVDPRWDDDVRVSPDRHLTQFLVPAMESTGYTPEDIQRFCSCWQEELQRAE